MTDTHPAPAAAVEDIIPALEAATVEDKVAEHVHGPDCSHDHDHDHEHGEGQQAPQHRNDFDLLETNGTKDKTTDPLVKVLLSLQLNLFFIAVLWHQPLMTMYQRESYFSLALYWCRAILRRKGNSYIGKKRNIRIPPETTTQEKGKVV